MHTTNDAHKYLREPPPVKSFPINYSTTTNRKIWRSTFSVGMPVRLRGDLVGPKKKMERGIPPLAPFHTVKRGLPVLARYGFPLGEF
jgi:hypothetical protein